jgi:hypothetical protein
MRKDQQKWGWKKGGGGRKDREVVSLYCNWEGMSSLSLFFQLSFPNEKSVLVKKKRSVVMSARKIEGYMNKMLVFS